VSPLTCPPVVLVVLVLVVSCGLLFPGSVPWASPHASLGSLRGRGGGCHLRTDSGVITARRAAATVAGQAEGRERASAAPGDNQSPGITVTRLRLELPGCPR